MNDKNKLEPTRANYSSGKMLALIELMSVQEQPLRLQELAQRSGLPPSTVHRFLSTLQSTGYAAQNEDDGRYFLTFKLCALAENIQRSQSMAHIALPYLRQLTEKFGESANLCVESNLTVMYSEVVPGPQKTLISQHYIGHVAPMHCTGAGKLLLTNLSAQQLDRFIERKGLPRLTARTLTSKTGLQKELDEIRENGYALDNEECEIGVRCVAAPVYDYRGQVVAGLSVSGPSLRMTDAHIRRHLPFLLEKARLLSERLGYGPEEK